MATAIESYREQSVATSFLLINGTAGASGFVPADDGFDDFEGLGDRVDGRAVAGPGIILEDVASEHCELAVAIDYRASFEA